MGDSQFLLQESLDRIWAIHCTSKLQQFFEELQSPDDLLAFEARILRPAVLLPLTGQELDEDVVPIHPQTEFGLFFRSVSLAFILLPFEVHFCCLESFSPLAALQLFCIHHTFHAIDSQDS